MIRTFANHYRRFIIVLVLGMTTACSSTTRSHGVVLLDRDGTPLPHRLSDTLQPLVRAELDDAGVDMTGTLRIRTGVDPTWQTAIEDAAAIVPDTKGRFVAAAVATDPTTGSLRAIFIDRRDTAGGKRATIQSSSGSTMKLITLVTAINNGIRPDDVIEGKERCTFGSYDATLGATTASQAPIRDMTAHSVNCAFARLFEILGPKAIDETAKSFGINRTLTLLPDFAAGANTVSLAELTTIVGTIANNGGRSTFHVIESIEGTAQPTTDRIVELATIMTADDAATVRDPLRSVVRNGTGARASMPGVDIIGKTGTQPGNTQAWFVGATEAVTAAVWMGNPNNAADSMSKIAEFSLDENLRGGGYPALVFRSILERIPTTRSAKWNEAIRDRDPVLLLAPGRDCATGPTHKVFKLTVTDRANKTRACS
jgi:penicillin-binding protein 1A